MGLLREARKISAHCNHETSVKGLPWPSICRIVPSTIQSNSTIHIIVEYDVDSMAKEVKDVPKFEVCGRQESATCVAGRSSRRRTFLSGEATSGSTHITGRIRCKNLILRRLRDNNHSAALLGDGSCWQLLFQTQTARGCWRHSYCLHS
jgi:hypothetical protein